MFAETWGDHPWGRFENQCWDRFENHLWDHLSDHLRDRLLNIFWLTVGWLLVGCRLATGWLLGDCWLIVGWLLVVLVHRLLAPPPLQSPFLPLGYYHPLPSGTPRCPISASPNLLFYLTNRYGKKVGDKIAWGEEQDYATLITLSYYCRLHLLVHSPMVRTFEPCIFGEGGMESLLNEF